MTNAKRDPPLSQQRATDLLRMISTGDEGAMAEFYRAFSALLLKDTLRQVKDPSVAEEVVQDTLLEIWRNPLGFRGESQLSTFLIGIARNKVRTAWRKQANAVTESMDDAALAELAQSTVCPIPDPSDAVYQQQLKAGIQRCTEKLSDVHADCLHLVYGLDLSLEEVAQIQGCPANTVKTRMFHARQKIKNCLSLLLKGRS